MKRNKGRMVQASYATFVRFIFQQPKIQSDVVYRLHAAHCEVRPPEARIRYGRATGHDLKGFVVGEPGALAWQKITTGEPFLQP